MDIYQGGCACGAVRYSSKQAPQFSFHCQCRNCQRVTGTGHSSLLMLTLSAVSVTGKLKFYEQPTDDGNISSSGFCPQCGSPVLSKSSGYPEIVFVHAASLDDPSVFKPQKVVWSSRKQHWDYTDPELPADA